MKNSDIIGFIVIFIIIFLVCREFVTWYWKQNKIVSLLESINSHLKKLTDHIPDLEEPEDEGKKNNKVFLGNEDVTDMIKK